MPIRKDGAVIPIHHPVDCGNSNFFKYVMLRTRLPEHSVKSEVVLRGAASSGVHLSLRNQRRALNYLTADVPIVMLDALGVVAAELYLVQRPDAADHLD